MGGHTVLDVPGSHINVHESCVLPDLIAMVLSRYKEVRRVNEDLSTNREISKFETSLLIPMGEISRHVIQCQSYGVAD